MKTKQLLVVFAILTFLFSACCSTTNNNNKQENESSEQTDSNAVSEEQTEKTINTEEGKVIALSSESFDSFINGEKIAIVDFYADWCRPCKMMTPVLDEFAKNNLDVVVGKINIDNANELAKKYEINSIPCFIVFKNANEIDRLLGGGYTVEEFTTTIKKNIK